MSAGSRSHPSQALPSRALPARPSLRHLKLEAKRRLGAGEFVTLHDAQTAIAREHGLPNWARLKQACTQDGPALVDLRWVVERFAGAGQPGWTAPGEDEFREHFDDRLLAAIPPGALTEAIAGIAPDLRTELVVIRQAPLEVQVQLAGQRYVAVAAAEPPHRLVGLRGFMLGDRITDPRVKAARRARTLGEPPDEIVAIATQARAELGLPALLLAGGEPAGEPVGEPAGKLGGEHSLATLGGRRRVRQPGPRRAARARPSLPAARRDRAGHRDRGAQARGRGAPGTGRTRQRPAAGGPPGRRLGDRQGPAQAHRRGGQPRRALRGQRARTRGASRPP